MSRENTSPLPHGDGEGRCLTSSPCAALLWSVALRGIPVQQLLRSSCRAGAPASSGLPRPSRFSKGGDFDAARESRFSQERQGRDFSCPPVCIHDQTFVCFPNQERNLMIVMNVTKIHAERLIQPPGCGRGFGGHSWCGYWARPAKRWTAACSLRGSIPLSSTRPSNQIGT